MATRTRSRGAPWLTAAAMLLIAPQAAATDAATDAGAIPDAAAEAAPTEATPDEATPDEATPDEATPAEEDTLPPLPAANEDFSADRALFKEVETASERFDQAAALKRAERSVPKGFYEKHPGLAYTTQAVAGLFAAGLLGLAGGTIGNAIDEGSGTQTLGGFHGPLIGATLGTIIGATLGVWSGGRLVDKPVSPWWIGSGTLIGSIVGGGAAAGIALSADKDSTSAGIGAGISFLVLQLTGAIWFGEIGLPVTEPIQVAPSAAPGPRGEWILPIVQGRF